MTKKIKIAFFDTRRYEREAFNLANQKFGFDITYLETKLSSETAAMAAGAEAVCGFVNDRVDAAAVDTLAKNQVKIIALRCAGYNNVDLNAVYKKIHVARVPSYSPHAIAEHAAALLLTITRHIHQAYNRVREGNFSLDGLVGGNLCGKTAGIIGTGKIGKIMAKICQGFGMQIFVYDKFPDQEWAKSIGANYADLESLCRKSEVISLHSPLTPETHHLLNAQLLSIMKPEACIINTGRGALINTKDLIAALKKKKIGGAALDVYEEEEAYFFQDWSGEVIEDDVLARLLTFPNVIITGHQAFLTHEALAAIAETTLTNIRDYFAENILPNEICYQCENKDHCAKSKTNRCW